jgi:short subunit fatty acids transporter
MMDKNKYLSSINDRTVIKKIETLGVLLSVIASFYLAIEQQSASLQLLYTLFLLSSVILTATTYVTRNYNFLLLNAAYLASNLIGFFNS